MSRLFRTLSVVALASSSTLAQAQQPATTLPAQPGQVQPAQPGQIQPAQPGQVQPGRPGQVQPGQVPGHTQAGHAGMQGQGVSLNAFIAHKLKRSNEAEVELGQMAVDKAEHDSVKEFAQMMVKSHQQMIQELQQFDKVADSTQERAGDAAPQERRIDGAVDGARNNVRNSESNTDGEARRDNQRTTSGASQSSSGTGTTQSNATPNQAGQPTRGQVAGQSGINQAGQAGQAQGRMGGMTGQVPQMLVALTDQTCDNELQLTKKMLEKHEGGDFEMAYIGHQIVAHNCMLAHLQALKNSGPQELQQLVTKGEQTTREHLDKAMKIAEELGSEKK